MRLEIWVDHEDGVCGWSMRSENVGGIMWVDMRSAVGWVIVCGWRIRCIRGGLCGWIIRMSMREVYVGLVMWVEHDGNECMLGMWGGVMWVGNMECGWAMWQEVSRFCGWSMRDSVCGCSMRIKL
ncbi:hypothetical protein DPMN_181195 [Dreissena polymorpha]|uniref:Uncharacterized protein n=1 Tax=Dreissena polymorpha TaxID=45954 RepID=A0A9D4DFS1_DREPO|nr:hypothetical protein DPMN_181195 [Dreissena polymorpha]